MDLITNRVKGTEDILPQDVYKWQFIEDVMKSQAEKFGFREIRTPIFEHTELFLRGVGATSDIVQKEMYTFDDKGGRSITLRPEGTACVLRSILQQGLYNEGLPIKVNYNFTCYRYEKPQAGRLREFRQFGVEVFGSSDPICDAEIICFAKSVLDRLSLKNIVLKINSIGCSNCRTGYIKALEDYFSPFKDELCESCKKRFDKNVMRLLDCKEKKCSKIASGAPEILNYLCKDCDEHFASVKDFLDSMGIKYEVDSKIVRGLDYYTKTVFEFVSSDLGAQGTVCAGGRYDNLAEELSGYSLAAAGLSFGVNRVLLLLDKQSIEIDKKCCDIYIGSVGERAKKLSLKLTDELRNTSFIVQCDLMGRTPRAQLKYANKINAKFSMIIGDNEIERGVATIKNMLNGENKEINIGDDFIKEFMKLSLDFNFKSEDLKI